MTPKTGGGVPEADPAPLDRARQRELFDWMTTTVANEVRHAADQMLGLEHVPHPTYGMAPVTAKRKTFAQWALDGMAAQADSPTARLTPTTRGGFGQWSGQTLIHGPESTKYSPDWVDAEGNLRRRMVLPTAALEAFKAQVDTGTLDISLASFTGYSREQLAEWTELWGGRSGRGKQAVILEVLGNPVGLQTDGILEVILGGRFSVVGMQQESGALVVALRQDAVFDSNGVLHERKAT